MPENFVEKWPLSGDDIAHMRMIAEKYRTGMDAGSMETWSETLGITQQEFQRLQKRLVPPGLLSINHPPLVFVTDKLIDYLFEFDNPPPVDEWERWMSKVKSQKWTLPVFVLWVLQSGIVAWVQLVKYFTGLF